MTRWLRINEDVKVVLTKRGAEIATQSPYLNGSYEEASTLTASLHTLFQVFGVELEPNRPSSVFSDGKIWKAS